MTSISRRIALRGAVALGFGASAVARAETVNLPFGNGERLLVRHPQKCRSCGTSSAP